jgi:hypothetical protein
MARVRSNLNCGQKEQKAGIPESTVVEGARGGAGYKFPMMTVEH